MTPAQVQQTMRQIEHARHLAEAATSVAERNRWHAEVRRMWHGVKPFVAAKKLAQVKP